MPLPSRWSGTDAQVVRPGGAGFRGSALLTALILAGLARLGASWILGAEPAGGVWLLTPGELWLLLVFTGGVLALLLAASVQLGGWFVSAPGESRSRRDGAGDPPGEGAAWESVDPARWAMGLGGWLLLIYAVGWLVTS